MEVPKGYTVVVYKADRRRREGERRVHYEDYETDDLNALEHTVKNTWLQQDGFRCEIHKTYVERVTIFGKPFVERYDTPYTASPRSETYWSS